jgi:hypothetical protein
MKRTIMSNDTESTSTFTVVEVKGSPAPTPYGKPTDRESRPPKRKEGAVMSPQKAKRADYSSL